jgi:uncharacterized protein
VVNSRLEIRTTPQRGRGVFSSAVIREGEVIERCPVIVVPPTQVEAIASTVLGAYFFLWSGTKDHAAIALGYGSLYNHDDNANAMYVRKQEEGILEFVALRAIAPGEEITVNYHGGFGERGPLWFEKAAPKS